MNATEPSRDNLKSVRELIEQYPAIDNPAVFTELRGIQDELWTKINRQFDLQMEESTRKFQLYSSIDGQAKGSLAGFSGGLVDWAVYSWIGNPAMSFSNMHTTIWMTTETLVPHLAFAFGTFPVTFFLMDYVPRVDVVVEPTYLDKYMQPANNRYLQLQADKRLMPYISQSVFVREVVSAVGYNFISPPGTPGVLELIRETAHEFLDRWLGWVEAGDMVPENERAALAKRDLAVRRNSAERDPANIVAERLYGKELTEQLVRGLWGGDRQSQRQIT